MSDGENITLTCTLTHLYLRTAGSKSTFWAGGTAVIPLGSWWARAETCLWMAYEQFSGTWTPPSHGNDDVLSNGCTIGVVVVRGQGSEVGLRLFSDTNRAFGFTFSAPFPRRTGLKRSDEMLCLGAPEDLTSCHA